MNNKLTSWLNEEKLTAVAHETAVELADTQEKKEPVSATQLQLELQNDPESHNELRHEELYDWRDLDDKNKQMYYLRKSIVRVARSKGYSVNAAKWYADRYASAIYDILAKKKAQ